MIDPLMRAVAHFNDERYREALLAFEERWHIERSGELRALIQLSNALNQLRLGLVTSPRHLLASAERLLAPRSEPFEGIDLGAVHEYIGAVRAVIPDGLETGAGSVAWDAVPRLRLGRAGSAFAHTILVAPGTPHDFADLRAFVAEAIREAFVGEADAQRYHPDLTTEQRAENAWVADIAPATYERSLADGARRVFVASVAGMRAGFVIVDRDASPCPEIDWLIVAPVYHGAGVAPALMDVALDWLGDATDVQLGVIHSNARAIAFYRKYGFVDTGRVSGKHQIPRRLLVRPRLAAAEGSTN